MYTNQLISSFKERLSHLCVEMNLSDSDIAKALGISKQTLSAWKCGTRSPKAPTIESVARHFGVSIEWLMGFDVPMEKGNEKSLTELELSEGEKALLELFNQVPEDQQQLVLQMIRVALDNRE